MSHKIAILTYHDGFNHGGFFQAFSTYSFLKSRGYDVEIINYKNKTHWLSEYKAFLFIKNPKTLVSNIKKIFAFKRDQEQMNLGIFKKDVKSAVRSRVRPDFRGVRVRPVRTFAESGSVRFVLFLCLVRELQVRSP